MLYILCFIIGMMVGSFFQKQYKKVLWDAMEDHNRFLQKQVDDKNKEIYNLITYDFKQDGS